MRTLKKVKALAATLLVGVMITGTASAAPVLCQVVTNNHMNVDSSIVSACLDAGVGNLNGNAGSDLFLNGDAGDGYVHIGLGGWTQDPQVPGGSTGTFTFNDSLWATYSDIAVSFKFGTGNQPDEWFVYSLESLASGDYDWAFVNVGGKGGGLSHIRFYGILGEGQVPEPATLALLGLALVVMGSCFRRQGRRAV